MKKTLELVFIPFPGVSHLVSSVEAAKLLLRRDGHRGRLAVTVLTMKLASERHLEGYLQKVSSDPDTPTALRFIPLAPQQPGSTATSFQYIESLKDSVRELLISDQLTDESRRIGGLVVGMFCTIFMEIAAELGIPVYVFYTSGACPLVLISHLLKQEDLDLTQYCDSDAELSIPCFSSPVPAKVIPRSLVEASPFRDFVISSFRRIIQSRGILVNTFFDMESLAIESATSDHKIPKLYPVGPILNLPTVTKSPDDVIGKWLDDQPESSVVFLCFGSMGSFEETQIREIATALEKSGIRFLWSLRKPPGKESGALQFTSDYESFEGILPEGFLNRTEGIGKVIGWAPQAAVLAHPAVGGFVSHCGWNSTLESVWFGVPVATFPLSAEQQVNAFHLVRELKMAEEIRIDYNVGSMGGAPSEVVGAEDIEAAIRRLVIGDGEVRRKVKEMQSKSRLALEDGGSSYDALNHFIEDVISNISP